MGHKKRVNSVDWHPDGNRVVTAIEDSTTIVWDTRTGQEILTLKGHDGDVMSAIYSPDGKMIATAGWDQSTKIWDAKTGQQLLTLNGDKKLPMSAVYRPDGTRILTVCRAAKIWDATTGRELVSLTAEIQILISQSFPCWSPNGDHIAIEVRSKTTNGNSIDETKVYDGKTGKGLLTLGSVHSATWSPDGKKIVAANWQGQPRLFDAQTGHSLIEKAGQHIGPISVVDWSPNGQQFLTASVDRTTKV